MHYDSAIFHRRSIRLTGYDYAQAGAYFVTIVTQGRENLFGQVIDGLMELNDAGKTIQSVWDDLPDHYPSIELDEFCILPNHIHGIIVIADSVGAGTRPAPNDAIHDNHHNNLDCDEQSGAPTRGAPTPAPNITTPGIQNNYLDYDPNDRASTDCDRAPTRGAPTNAHDNIDPINRVRTDRAQDGAPTKHLTLGDIIGGFKSITTDKYILGVNNNGWTPFNGKLWQRNYYEHIIRNEIELNRIREYIQNNPLNWGQDAENIGRGT
jgi:putative transposase